MGAFSVFSTKKRRQPERVATPASTYESYARRVSYLKYAVSFVLVVFVVFGFTFFGEELSIENFRYMMKFISVNADSTVKDGAEINTDLDTNGKAVVLGGDVVLTDSNGIQIFDVLGERYLHDTKYQSNPMCVTNGSHAILCGRGGYDVTVYSAYTAVYTTARPYPVLDLCGSGSGKYALLTAAKGYRSGIEVYDEHFRMVYSYYFAAKYVSGIGLSADGKRAAACTLTNTDEGEYLGELHLFDTSSAENVKSLQFADEIPWKVFFLQNGGYYFMTNKAVRIFDSADNMTATVTYGDHSPKSYCFSDDGIVLALSEAGLSNSTLVRYYDAAGKETGSDSFYNDASSISICGGYAFVYSVGTLHTVRISDAAEIKTDDVGNSFLMTLYDSENDRLLFIYRDKVLLYGMAAYTGLI